MNNFVISITVLLIGIILLFPRRWAAIAIVASVLYLTQIQNFVIFGMNLFPIRFIELAGILRVFLRREIIIHNFNNIDKAFCIYNIALILIYLIRCIDDINSRNLITYQIGIFVDGMLVYIVFRGLIDNIEKLLIFLMDIVFLLIPFTVFMIIEGITGKNVFSYMVDMTITPYFRDGYYRCQASFRHAILAGSVGATMLPLFLLIMSVCNNNIIGGLGIILCVVIVLASHSSGPFMALSIGILACFLWPLRNRMKIVQWSIFWLLLFLHIIMKSPAWYLIARISDIIGGDGWHRANLINQWINSIGDWWVWGMSWNKTVNWAATTMPWGGVDVTNEYINISINGGIISLILFIMLLGKCYSNLGRKIAEAAINGDKNIELVCWGLGASLTSHVLNLLSVSYWDQFYVLWYMLLSIISGITGDVHGENDSRAVDDSSIEYEKQWWQAGS